MLDKLPTILILAVLVGIFLALQRHSTTTRVRLWTYAWALIFVHFVIQIFEGPSGRFESIFQAIDLGALELSGLVFVVSMSRSVEDRFYRRAMLIFLCVPAIFHATAVSLDWQMRWPLVIALVILTLAGGAVVLLEEGYRSPVALVHATVILITGAWAIRDQWRGNSALAFLAILTLAFATSGVWFWRGTKRWSPGVVAVAGGFLAWGAVFPMAELVGRFFPDSGVTPELWNVPKYFVAIGMVLNLLEDKSRLVEEAHVREHAENRLLQKTSQISSRLLASRDPFALCGEIAEGITSASSFNRAALFVAGEDGRLALASARGVSEAEKSRLDVVAGKVTWATYQEALKRGKRLGNSAVLLDTPELAKRRGVRTEDIPAGFVVLIPLISARCTLVGGIWLASDRRVREVDPGEIAKLEMLAGDLAVTLENTRLQGQLVRTEKLAALGQLVAGVAHELNNPLTGILGYSELLAEEVKKESTLKRVEKLGNEARRMKRIVDGLLHFARQSTSAARSSDLGDVIRDVVQLREYHLRKLGIQVEMEIDHDLPAVAIGDDQLRQLMMNLFGNAIDAVEDSRERKIRVFASARDGRVCVRFEDTGPGFSELNRALDPFYTTKPVGKGTGLGLSICYGILQECGGEIILANKPPYGASVTIEIPVSVSATAVSPIRA
jgi:C4-dicarboxylate-specific signal transduction histidine kinase